MRRISVFFTGLLLAFSATAFAAPISVEDAIAERVLGDPNAPVTIIEYASLTCGHCANFHSQTLPELKRKYIETGKVKLIVRDFPFDAVSARAAMVARCVDPNLYFKFMDALFQKQSQWARADEQQSLQALAAIAKVGGLGEEDFNACVTNEAILDGILQRRLEAVQKFEVQATPTFIIHDDKIEGAMPIETFDDVIAKYLDE